MKKKTPPILSWQTGDFERIQTLDLLIPQPFLIISKLCGLTPKELLIDFMDNLGCGSWKRENHELPRQKLIDYFISHDYGQQYYNREEIREIFTELTAIGLLYPHGGSDVQQEAYVKWRETHHQYLFEKWYYKNSRKI